jgi:hypothetical protein
VCILVLEFGFLVSYLLTSGKYNSPLALKCFYPILILRVVGLHSAGPQPKITVAEINLQLNHPDWIHQTSGFGSAIWELEMDGGLRGEAPLGSVPESTSGGRGWYNR